MSRRVRFFAAGLLAAGLALAAPAAAQTFSKTTHVGLYDPLVADLNGDGHWILPGPPREPPLASCSTTARARSGRR